MTQRRGTSARQVAFKLLGAMLDKGRTLDQALADGQAALNDLPARDRGFARLLVLTALRRLGQIDDALNQCLSRPLDRRAARIRPILRLAAAQLLFLDTPPHAAVNEAVAAARRYPQYKGLINAVLRRLQREKDAILANQDPARLNCPDWLWQAFAPYDRSALLTALLTPAPLDLTVKDDPESWATCLDGEVLPGGTVRLHDAGNIADLPGYDAGDWWVQDAGAALPARILAPAAGDRVLDLCAAPGGKTAQLAAMGADVTALDISDKRLGRLRENLKRLKLSAEIVAADAAEWHPQQLFDLVLLDAPCSATGTIRRRPDVLHLREPADIERMIAVQDALLDNLQSVVRPGGRAIYCVCSLISAEGAARIASLLTRFPNFTRLPIDAGSLGLPPGCLTSDGDVLTQPHMIQGGIDGFYIAQLERQE